MALITCPECSKQISSSAVSCPHCGFPLQSDINQTISTTCPQKAESHRRKKKTRMILSVVLSTVVCILACVLLIFVYGQNQENNKDSTKPKDKDYLYNWLTEHGTLVDGTSLQYAGTDENGNRFTLRYDPNYTEELRWQVQHVTKDTTGRTIETILFLFSDSEKSEARIWVDSFGIYSNYYRTMWFCHNQNTFTKNSPIERGDINGSTVHIPDADKGLIAESRNLNNICTNNAQKNLCLILDWLKESFCKTANMTMSDFGYDQY